MQDIVLIDDCIPKEVQDEIEEMFTDAIFPWYYLQSSNYGNDIDNIPASKRSLSELEKVSDCPQFFHNIYSKDKWCTDLGVYNFFKIILSVPYSIGKILRIKSNLTYPIPDRENTVIGIPHCDFTGNIPNLLTGIYYVNDSDGETIIFNEVFEDKIYDNLSIKLKIEPKKGRLVLFNGSYLHCATNPYNTSHRIVVNFNFLINNI
jgi:hypothetical protein